MYTYVATYDASADGEYTATLDFALDTNGNNGSNNESANKSIRTTDSQSESTIATFEDESLTGWENVETASITDSKSYAGQQSLVVTDNNGDYGSGIGNYIYYDINGGTITPSKLQGALLIGQGTYNTARMYWGTGDAEANSEVNSLFTVGIDNQDPLKLNGNTLVQSTPNEWYFVELDGIDWENNVIAQVIVNGSTVDQDVSFPDDPDGISRVGVHVHDGGTGSTGHFDNLTIGSTEEDTTPPSISAFSISNPSDQQLRISFDSNEQLGTIQTSITGPESATLTSDNFTRTGPVDGRYTYEATYDAGADGEYTATLDIAADVDGNNGASNESVTVSIKTAEPASTIATFEDESLTGWENVETASITDSKSYAGQQSLVVTDNNGDYGSGIGNYIYYDIDSGTITPSKLQGALLIGQGTYNTARMYWGTGDAEANSEVNSLFTVGIDNQDPLKLNGNTLVQSTPNEWYFVELDEIDWEDNIIGEVIVNGSTVDQDVSFPDDPDGISRVGVHVHDGGTGSTGHFDNLTIGSTE